MIALLFDFDGVVADTESQYSNFWRKQGIKYKPEIELFEQTIKGQTLKHIYDNYFNDRPDLQAIITKELEQFEENMEYQFINGCQEFLDIAKQANIPMAIVTSSDNKKMQIAQQKMPKLNDYFTYIVTAEQFKASKPAPDGYLKAAQLIGAEPKECIIFEDSFNGIKSGNNAAMQVVGVATTNSAETINSLCNMVINDFTEITLTDIYKLIQS